MNARAELWKGLVWSNPDADLDVRIRAALLRPRFSQILDIVHAFGLARVETEWEGLRREGTVRANLVATRVERILRNIHRGAAVATARD